MLEAMGLTSKGLERSQAARKGERFGFRTGMALRTVRTLLMGHRRYLIVLATIFYLGAALSLWTSPPVKTHLLQLLSELRSPSEVGGCGCQQTGPLPSEAEMRAHIRSTERHIGGESK